MGPGGIVTETVFPKQHNDILVKVTLDISRSSIEIQWVSYKYPG